MFEYFFKKLKKKDILKKIKKEEERVKSNPLVDRKIQLNTKIEKLKKKLNECDE